MLFRIDTARRIVQFICFISFNAVLFGLKPLPILLPIVGVLGSPQKTVGDALGALQLMLYEPVAPWLALASIFLASVFLGRAFCGWACPFGLVQDLLSHVKRRHRQVSLRAHGQMIFVKYVVLAVVLFLSGTLAASSTMGLGESYREALGVIAPAPFNVFSPADTLFAVLPRIVFEARYVLTTAGKTVDEVLGMAFNTIISAPLLWLRLAIMAFAMALAINIPRGWCRYLCPQGAFSALISSFSFLGLKRDPVRCSRVACRACVEACPTMVPILDLPWEKFTHPECIYCARCIDACSEKAIKPKFP